MCGELLAGEDVLPIRLHVLLVSSFLIVPVNHERAVDLHGRIAIWAVESQAAAETPGLTMIPMLGHRVGPDRYHLRRLLRLILRKGEPRGGLLPIQLGATGREPQARQRREQVRKPKGGWHEAPFHREGQLSGAASLGGTKRSS